MLKMSSTDLSMYTMQYFLEPKNCFASIGACFWPQGNAKIAKRISSDIVFNSGHCKISTSTRRPCVIVDYLGRRDIVQCMRPLAKKSFVVGHFLLTGALENTINNPTQIKLGQEITLTHQIVDTFEDIGNLDHISS